MVAALGVEGEGLGGPQGPIKGRNRGLGVRARDGRARSPARRAGFVAPWRGRSFQAGPTGQRRSALGAAERGGRAWLRGWLAGPAGRPTGRASWARARGRREQAGASRAWGVGAGLGREESGPRERVGLG